MTESITKTAIITAVITGVVTIAAGVATYWLTTKEPALAYSLIGGPSLAGSEGAKRIFVVEVRNSGRKEISQTLVQLSLNGGELSEVSSEASPGVNLTEEKTPKRAAIRADLLNPGDIVKVSFLTSLATRDGEPDVVVRAPGVRGVAESQKRDGLLGKGRTSVQLVLAAAALGAVLSSLTLTLSRSSVLRKLGLPSLAVPSIHQSEGAAFVCGACGLFEESERLRFGGSEISYRGTADYLRARATLVAPEGRRGYLAALRALLLDEAISSRSQSTIRAAIEAVDPQGITDAEFETLRGEAIDEGGEPIAWRNKVQEYVRAFRPAA